VLLRDPLALVTSFCTVAKRKGNCCTHLTDIQRISKG
jgi:hypothetical protein